MSLQTHNHSTTSRLDTSPRAALVAIAAAHPKDDNAAIFRKFRSELNADPDLRDAVERSWFSQTMPNVRQELERRELARLKKGTPRQRAKALKIESEKVEQRSARATQRLAKAAQASTAVTQVLKSKLVAASKANILGMIMPDGRPLAEWRCSDLGRLSGFFGRIAREAGERGVPDELAGKVFSERQLQKLHKEK